MTVDIALTSGTIVTPQTIRNIVHDPNNRERGLLKKKRAINETNRVERHEFEKAYIDKPLKFGENIIFSSKIKFNNFV